MPSLQFANLGPTPEFASTSVSGNLFVLMLEGSNVAIVFDARRYDFSSGGEHEVITFKRIGTFEIPVLSSFAFKSANPERPSFSSVLETMKDVYVVSLSGVPPTSFGWNYICWLFPNAAVRKVPLGRTDWCVATEEEKERGLIRDVEATGLVERGEKVEIGPYSLYLFRSLGRRGGNSVLVSGEAMDRSFAFFFGDSALSEFFLRDRIDLEPFKLHRLSLGRWHAFYSLSVAESLPVQMHLRCT